MHSTLKLLYNVLKEKKGESGGRSLCIYILCLILYSSNECICIIIKHNIKTEGFS